MIQSWNRYPKVKHAGLLTLWDRNALLPTNGHTLLPYGNGRSYGDVCLNADGLLLHTRRLDRFIAFDACQGLLRCESGVLLKDILDLVVPQNWFLAVTPGTQYVTVGGAIANDVHGKNHHIAGSFGHHVRCLELLRSDGQRIICSPVKNSKWFRATIGGMGLTGLITWAELQLIPIANPAIVMETHRFASLDHFWELNQELEQQWPYTVAWIDCTSRRGRGLLLVGQHAPTSSEPPPRSPRSWRFPVDLPISLINGVSLRLFNELYYRLPRPQGQQLVHYQSFFHPLDRILEWNRVYGSRGFFQYQCVLPPATARDGIAELLRRIATSGSGSFLAVLKRFGDKPAAGLFSFPRPGVTLALDFPNQGITTFALFRQLDAVVRDAGGALYPAKDACMPGDLFRRSYPQWEAFSRFIDPKFSSSFWRRVTGDN
jgi:FAD/FMN-containing dehydrogenase